MSQSRKCGCFVAWLSFQLCGLFLCGIQGAWAADKVLDANRIGKAPVSLTEYFSVLEDPSRSLTLAQVQQPVTAAKFKSAQAPGTALNLGLTPSAYWLRLHLKNTRSTALDQLLEISNSRLLHVDFFQVAPGMAPITIQSGYGKPFSSRPYKHRFFVFPVVMAAKAEQLIYLRVEAPLVLEIPAKLWNRDDFHDYESNDLLAQAMYFGMVFAMLSFNFLLWISLKERIYGLYLLFVVGTALGQAGVTGLGVQFLWADVTWWTTISLGLGSCFASIGFISFMQHMLGTAKNLPRYDKVLTVLVVVNWLVLVSCFVSYNANILVFMGVLNTILTLLGAGICAYKGQRSAKLFLLAFIFLLVGIILYILRIKGVFPGTFLTINGIQIGSAMEMILLAFALADRFNQIRWEKAKYQRELLQSQGETLQAQAETMQAQAEKVTSLTQLVANVAHEINTPIGAVKSSARTISDALGDGLGNLPRLFGVLDPPLRALFSQLVGQLAGQVNGGAEPLTSREERAIKNKLVQQLEQAGIQNAERRARLLVSLRAYSTTLDYLPLLKHPECDFILGTAHGIGSIIINTANISTAVDRVAKIVTTLKSFSQADSIGEMTEINLRDNIEAVLMIYSNRIKQNTELVRQYQELPPLRCLPDDLTQVWTHLIHNALQAMSSKGTLTIGLRYVGNEAVVSVTDSGVGIPGDILGRIFEPFFTTRPPGEGSGLGLDIVKKMLEKHKGRIEVQSEIGVGSTFSVYIPY
jgi:signal transduction histidine kinase